MRVVEALVALDELLDGDRLGALAAEDRPARARGSAASSARIVSEAPAPLRGLRISGKPTCSANARASAALPTAAEAAVGTPASRSACFIDGLSRHSQAVRTDVPGMVHASRTCAVGQDVRLDRGLEPVDPQLVLHPADRAGHRLHVGDRRHLLVVVQPALELVVQRVRRGTRRCRSPSRRPRPARGRSGAGWRGRTARRTRRSCLECYAGRNGTPGPDCGLAQRGIPEGMVVAAFVAPYLLDATMRFVEAAAGLPGIELALITCEPESRVPVELRPRPGRALADRRPARRRADRRRRPRRSAGTLGPVQRLFGGARAAAGAARAGPRAPGHRRHGRGDRAQLPRQGADEVGAAGGRRAVRAAPAGRFGGRGGRLRRRGRVPAGGQAARRAPGPRARSVSTTPTTCGCGWTRAPPAPDRPALLEEFLTGEEGSYDSVMVGRADRLGLGLALPAHAAGGAAQPVDPVAGAHAARHRRARVRRHPGDRAGGAAGARAAHRAHAHGVVPAARRLGRRLRGRGAAAGRPDHLDALLRPRLRLLPRLGAAHGARQLRRRRTAPWSAGTVYLRGQGSRAGPGGARPRQRCRPR